MNLFETNHDLVVCIVTMSKTCSCLISVYVLQFIVFHVKNYDIGTLFVCIRNELITTVKNWFYVLLDYDSVQFGGFRRNLVPQSSTCR